MKIKRNYTNCPNCDKKISVSTLQRHLNGKQCGKIPYTQHFGDNCNFCNKEIHNKGSLIAHIKCCKLNPDRVSNKRSPHAGKKKGCVAWNKGKSNIELYGIEKAALIKQKVSKSITDTVKRTGSSWSKMSKEQQGRFKEKHKHIINDRYEKGWLPKAGRCKKLHFFSKFAGEITVDGTWEHELAIYLDEKNINWKRNKKRFSYINGHNSQSFYTPDFYLVDYNIYIEVKGYETEKDRCKWSCFTEKLIVFKRNEIKKIKEKIPFEEVLRECKTINLISNPFCSEF